jgi:hypothetical protein
LHPAQPPKGPVELAICGPAACVLVDDASDRDLLDRLIEVVDVPLDSYVAAPPLADAIEAGFRAPTTPAERPPLEPPAAEGFPWEAVAAGTPGLLALILAALGIPRPGAGRGGERLS